jgi:hypothetical protein
MLIFEPYVNRVTSLWLPYILFMLNFFFLKKKTSNKIFMNLKLSKGVLSVQVLVNHVAHLR